MLYEITLIGFVPERIINKAMNMLKSKIHWKKIKRNPQLKSCRISDNFRLVKDIEKAEYLLMDHTHYNRIISA